MCCSKQDKLDICCCKYNDQTLLINIFAKSSMYGNKITESIFIVTYKRILFTHIQEQTFMHSLKK